MFAMDCISESLRRYTACTAYSRYILDVGQSQDWFALQMAMLPCLLGYALIAKRLMGMQTLQASEAANKYHKWMENYVAEDYSEAVQKGCGRCGYHVH